MRLVQLSALKMTFLFCLAAASSEVVAAEIRQAFGYELGVAPPFSLDGVVVKGEGRDTYINVFPVPSKARNIAVFDVLEMQVSTITGNVFQLKQSKEYSSNTECEKAFRKVIGHFEKTYKTKAAINAFNWYKFRSDDGKRFIDLECNERERRNTYSLDFKFIDAVEGKKISEARSRLDK